MCRWLAYSGSPILLEELLYKPAHSLIDQSMHARLGATTTNGDGFGRDFPQVKRELSLAVDPSLYPAIEGSADSEVRFFLALTFGLEHDPPAAVAQMVGFGTRCRSPATGSSTTATTNSIRSARDCPRPASDEAAGARAPSIDTSVVAASAWPSRPRSVGGSR
jgi:hypothetical protein